MSTENVRVRLKRSPGIVCYWEDDQLIYHNYLTGVRITASPLCAAILNLFDGRRRCGELFDALHGFSRQSLKRILEQLVNLSFLVEENPNSRSRRLEELSSWSPIATFYHLATKDMKYRVRLGQSPQTVHSYLRAHPQPPFFKRHPGAKIVVLPSVELPKEGSFVDVLLRRRTWREFSKDGMDLQTLSRLLYLSWGVTDYLKVKFLGRLPLKTSPSAGARHPIEVYVVPLRIEGLPQGIYHYSSDRHHLECLRLGPMKRHVIRYLGGQNWFQDAAAVFFMTAVFSRVYWKYRYPRAYRTVLLDAGHVCQTFCLTATWLGLAPFCTAALADTLIEKALGVDGIRESVVYVAGVGNLP
jgi:SagB-type dehydrogenase family enzyme